MNYFLCYFFLFFLQALPNFYYYVLLLKSVQSSSCFHTTSWHSPTVLAEQHIKKTTKAQFGKTKKCALIVVTSQSHGIWRNFVASPIHTSTTPLPPHLLPTLLPSFVLRLWDTTSGHKFTGYRSRIIMTEEEKKANQHFSQLQPDAPKSVPTAPTEIHSASHRSGVDPK